MIKDFFIKNGKLMFGIILGIVISTTSYIFADFLNASDVSYDSTNGKIKNVTNVQGAIDSLYDTVSNTNVVYELSNSKKIMAFSNNKGKGGLCILKTDKFECINLADIDRSNELLQNIFTSSNCEGNTCHDDVISCTYQNNTLSCTENSSTISINKNGTITKN